MRSLAAPAALRWAPSLVLSLSLLAALPPAAAAADPAPGSAPTVEAGARRSGARLVPSLSRRPRLAQPARRAPASGTTPVEECALCEPAGSFERSDFRHPTRIDNEWWPMEPGRRLAFQARSNADGEMLDHHMVFTVTDLVKEIGGIRCVVVWIEDVEEGVLTEAKLVFFAQSDEGDVWHAGEYPEEYDLGEFVTAEATWIHGIEEARAGLLVPEDPTVGAVHEQASAPSLEYLDCGTVVSVQERHRHRDRRHGRDDDRDREKFCVPDGCFREILTTREWAPLEACPEILYKTYAKGRGLVQFGPTEDPEGETWVRVESARLSHRQMRAARRAALALDEHGVEVSEVYAQTEPATRAGGRERPDDDDDDLTASAEVTTPASRVFLAIGNDSRLASTSIAYGLAEAGPVELSVFDVLGRRVRSLVDQSEGAGAHLVRWDGRDRAGNPVSRGVYFIRLRVADQTLARTIFLAR
jgi:hypothetical protein